jgi:hypothetical protein
VSVALEVRAVDEAGLHLHYHHGVRRERAMFATLGFVVALSITRAITSGLHAAGAGDNGGIVIGDVHVHHLVAGIFILLLVGYAWLLLAGVNEHPTRWSFRISAVAYGVGSALVLDEFALWLRLKDIYWERQGRESFEALAIFAGLLLWALLVAPFANAVLRRLRGLPTPRRTSRL